MADAALDRLREAAARWGYPPSAVEGLARYVDAVLAENERVNLTGARTREAALEVLAEDSLPVVLAWDGTRGAPRTAVDLGTGNGLPGVAVALAWPSCRVLLLDRRERKARAVERCLSAAGVAGAGVACCDGRELLARRPDLRGAVDLVTVRAVGDLGPTTREAAPWVAPGGRVVHWKPGDLSREEREGGLAAARQVGLAPRPDVEYPLGARGAARRLVVYERPR